MKKDAFYFSHDYNAHNDTKILYMRQELGMEGYGIYWFLVESLADSGGILPLKILPVLAKQMDVTEAKVNAIINSYELFQVAESQFFSERLIQHLDLRNGLSKAGKLGAAKRWENRGAISHPNAKERKGKEIKGKEIKESTLTNDLSKSNLFKQPNIPTEQEVTFAFTSSGGTNEMAEKFFNKYSATGWFLNGSPISNFKFLIPSFISNFKSITKSNESNTKLSATDKFNAYTTYADRFIEKGNASEAG